MIADLVEFASKPRTALEFASLRLSGYSATKQGTFKRLYKEKVKRQPRRNGGGFVFSFWDIPSQWQNDIMIHFVRGDQPKKTRIQEVSQKEIDAILYSASTMDERFALEWRKREKYLEEVHRRIINILLGL